MLSLYTSIATILIITYSSMLDGNVSIIEFEFDSNIITFGVTITYSCNAMQMVNTKCSLKFLELFKNCNCKCLICLMVWFIIIGIIYRIFG